MATGKRFYWIKLKDTFFTSDTVDFIMSQPNGAEYIVLYQMLHMKTANTGGRLQRQIGEMLIPYDMQKIKRDCKWFSEDTIRVALELYKQLGLVYEDSNGVLVMADHENMVGQETDWAEKKRRQKEQKSIEERRLLEEGKYPYKIGDCTVVSYEQIIDSAGNNHFVDNKRYGGNGMVAMARADGKCELCGSRDDVVIHHKNGYSNELSDLIVLCRKCHGKAHSENELGTNEGSIGESSGENSGENFPIDIRDKRLDIRVQSIDIDTSKENNKKKGSDISEDVLRAFNEFWSVYSEVRNDTRSEALHCFNARIKEGFDFEKIMACTRNYVDECKREKKERRWVLMPKTFLGPNLRFLAYEPTESKKKKCNNPYDDGFVSKLPEGITL